MKLTVRILTNGTGDYTAVCPSLPGCSSRGGTRQEAKERLEEAIRGYLASVSNFVPENVGEHLVEA